MNNITKDDVVEAENKLFLARLANHVDLLDQLLDDNLTAVAPTGELLTKEMDLNSHKSKTIVIEDAFREIDQISLFGDATLSIAP
ncbi:DUF4440 domain-containing protein [Sphingobacterium suaedae]|uniref:DUF4440 domain-containing protein n=1 Tax=Sphingobacterium suaedae TaxID=1686402 RepID=A0ABW5KPG5_9SPHI